MTPRDDYYRSLIPLAPHNATCPSGGRWPTLFCCAPAAAYRAAHWPPPADPRTALMLPETTPAERRRARVLSALRWAGAAFLVALALYFGWAMDEMPQALAWIAFAAVAVLAVVQPWKNWTRRKP